MLGDIVDLDTTNCEQALLVQEHLFSAFKHAQSDIRLGERPSRALVRLSFSLMHNLLDCLAEKDLQAQDSMTGVLSSICESSSTRKGTGAANNNSSSFAPGQPSCSGEADKAS